MHVIGGQARARSLGETLAIARALAPAAGVTRLAELTHLDEIGLPVFHVTRPLGRSLSTAMGRGDTCRAAMVSALVEAIEVDVAERIAPAGPPRPLADFAPDIIDLWSRAPRDAVAVRLDPRQPRHWIEGTRLDTGAAVPVPFDLVSLDMTRPEPPDTLLHSAGLATGNGRTDALVSALAELLEYDLEADFGRASPMARRACEIDIDSIDAPAVRDAVARFDRAGCDARLWSLGQDHGLAAILCTVTDPGRGHTRLPPMTGTACHADRGVAALRALQEAAQGRAALIAGARDDMTPESYTERDRRAAYLLFSRLSFGPGPLPWRDVPHAPGLDAAGAFDLLRNVAQARTDLPLILVPMARPHPALEVLRLVAPGLRILARRELAPSAPIAPPSARPIAPPHKGRRLIFVGPTLWNEALPPGIERRAPAEVGDMAALCDAPPEAVGLVDGVFETAASVWHKELVELMSRGTIVYGAASLGALRAAELQEAGMRGVGAIFAACRDGMLLRDDAVMIAHAPSALAYRPLTLALVDAEAALREADLPGEERRQLQRIARRMSFRERSWAAMLDRYRIRTGRPPTLGPDTFAAMPSLKRRDALELASLLAGPLPRAAPCPPPPMSACYQALRLHLQRQPRPR